MKEVDLSGFYICSLNHVVRQHPVDLAHIIDIDVVDDCKDILEKHARTLVLPFFPHVRHDPTSKTIEDFIAEMPVLQALRRQGRLVWYNLSSAKRTVGSSPVIVARFFSAEAALNILVACGVNTVRSLGVDGGASYAASYKDLEGKTLLANKHPSFDRQFEQIARTIMRSGIFYAPLHKEAPVRVFVGTDRTQRLAARVLEFSIKRSASMTVEFVPMCDLPVPTPKDPANRPRTGFSFARFLIPSLCGYQGRAIYLDADMLVFDDITRLWEWPMGDADVVCAEAPTSSGRIRQYSVLVLDCAKLSWRIDEIVKGLDEGRYTYKQLMYDFCIVPPSRIAAGLPPEWNSLEKYEPGRTRLLHYTDMPTQPWVSDGNPHGHLWYTMVREALAEGFLGSEEIYREVRAGHVSPDLPKWVGLANLPRDERLRQTWVPPYRRFQREAVGTPSTRRMGWFRFR
ncbi:MAG TPA: glycosyltransferase [Dehalococcoidia bacterium]|nr:glycosyltransferase [Dehalococcoidia bacterium]